jgi:hypothetical protein
MELAKPLKLGAGDRVWYSPDGKRLAVRSSQLSVWDLEKNKRLWRSNPVPYLYYATFSPDGKRLAVKSTTGQIVVVDANNGKVVCDFRNKKDEEGCNLIFSPCGKFIIDGTWEGRLLVRAVATGKIEFEREYANESVHDIYAVDGGSSFVVLNDPRGGDDNKKPPAAYLSRWKWPFGAKPIGTIKLADQLYHTSAVTADGQFFAFDSSLVPKKPSIDVLSLRTGKRVASIPYTRGEHIEQLNWSADGALLGAAKRDCVEIYSAVKIKFELVVKHELENVRDIAFSPTGDTIALAAKNSVVMSSASLQSSTAKASTAERGKGTKAKAAPPPAASFIHAAEHQKAFKKIVSSLPAKSKIRQLLPELACDDEDRNVAAYELATDFNRSKRNEDVCKPNFQLSENEAAAILSAGAIAEFPPAPPDGYWQDGYHTLLTQLWRSPYPALLPQIAPAYEKQPYGTRRAALLALLGVLGTREAAETFVACIRKFGWPSSLYVRVWSEFEKLLAHGDVLLPDVALAASKDQMGDLVDAISSALMDGAMPVKKVASRLDVLTPRIVASISKLIKQLSKYQSRKGIDWRFGENYSYARAELSSLLALAGYLIDPKLPPLLREAAKFTDPVIAVSAAVAMLRQSGDANKSAFRRAAQSHETRAYAYEILTELKRKDLFPREFATWEAFAASAMVEWLKFPTELEREPDELKLGHTEWIDKRRKLVMYVWKFRNAKEPWLAGVSGPHELRGSPRPTHGAFTFSRFEEWDSATPQEHLEQCAGSAKEIVEASS